MLCNMIRIVLGGVGGFQERENDYTTDCRRCKQRAPQILHVAAKERSPDTIEVDTIEVRCAKVPLCASRLLKTFCIGPRKETRKIAE